jgi:hypothetical protein
VAGDPAQVVTRVSEEEHPGPWRPRVAATGTITGATIMAMIRAAVITVMTVVEVTVAVVAVEAMAVATEPEPG